jgi:S-DNA-T family DNA segregation ATPase FtsK/SpoIIIE
MTVTTEMKISEILVNFDVSAKVVGVVRGPSVTRYEVQLAPGVKISKLTSITDEIALNLAVESVRVVTVKGKSVMGIEVPNCEADAVTFNEILYSEEFKSNKSSLAAILGKGITGENIISDIAEMPHLLIAGTTGSGKSVCINSIIMSIIKKATPDDVRFIMIDPKVVELSVYNDIPHLLTPVITDPEKAIGGLKWAVTQMENRYNSFAERNVRNIDDYNKITDKKLPKIVIVIDEMADLMMTAPKECETQIIRLAQKARAAGIHLILATQRPTVKVITGLIKANIPSRIALKVASLFDSRTIIDTAGAEKLLGKGDMLYAPIGVAKPIRVQGCWVSPQEINDTVATLKGTQVTTHDTEINIVLEDGQSNGPPMMKWDRTRLKSKELYDIISAYSSVQSLYVGIKGGLLALERMDSERIKKSTWQLSEADEPPNKQWISGEKFLKVLKGKNVY